MVKQLKSTIVSTFIATSLLSGAAMAMSVTELQDTNGDGVISAEEITAAREAAKAEKLAQFDTDGNGELSRNERRAMKDARYNAMLVDFDADGDGELSRDERRAAKDARRAALEAQLDVNGDGELSAEEAAGMEQVKAEGGKKRGKKRGA